MRSVGTRFVLPFALITLVFSLFIVYRTYSYSWNHANELLKQQAALASEFNLRIRDYVGNEVRPRMESLLGKDGFNPQTMSTSFASHSIVEAVRAKFPDFVIRFASDAPRNPKNTANADELKMIAFFRENPGVEHHTEVITIDGKRYIAQFTPKWMKPECMRCHGDPKDAPAELIAQYGAEASFHRKVGDVAGLDTVAVPLDAVQAMFAADMRRQSLMVAGGLAVLFGSVLFLFRRAVTRRLVSMAEHIRQNMDLKDSSFLAPIPVSGRDEISVLGRAFNRLVEQLHAAHSSLERRVEERTGELARVNEELRQEIEERRRMEKALSDSERRFHAILSNIPDWAWMKDLEGRYIGANEPFARAVGYKNPDDLLGKNDFDFWPEEHARKYLRDDAEIIASGFGKEIEEAAGRENEFRWLHTMKRAVFDEDGRIIGTVGIARDITERKRAQEEANQAYALLAGAMEQSSAGLMIADAPNARIRLVNKAAEEILMMPQEEQTQISAENTKAITWQSFHPDGRPFDQNELPMPQSILHGRTIKNQEIRVVRHDGSERWILVNSAPIYTSNHEIVGAVAVFPDITDRKRIEQAFAESEARFRALFESMTEGVALHELVYGAHGKPENYRILDVNPAFVKHTGIAPEKARGALATELYQAETPPYMDLFQKVALTGFPYTFETFFDPMEKYFQISVFSPRKGLFATVFEDINDRKRAEEERLRLEAQVQQAQKLESLGVLAGGIAHDFNNMLMAILGNADLALQDLSAVSPARPMLEDIDRTAHRAADLCKQMLAYSGKGRFIIKPINLSEVVEEMGHMLDVSISKRAVLRYHLDKALPAVEADATQVRQVIMNLIINASEAIGDHNGVISITTGHMECDKAYLRTGRLDDDLAEGQYVFLEVSDSGCGMDQETLQRIFDPFFTTKFTGRGLGLAAVLGIVRGHKGSLRVYSEVGKGTTFKVLLPAVAAASEKTLETPPNHLGWKGSGIVLLVDDEESILGLCRRMLERLGFEVITARNGCEALEIFAAQKAQVRCVLLDLTMPNMDGEEAFRELRRLDPEVRVIMSSGYNEQEVVNRFAGKGLAGFIQKPYRIANLAAVLKAILDV